ncbi:hypothetical protein HanIR_Chr11g0547081 [Helianthus annuus]|nr:hypothetical protein HanIR_Chr11g0547081 [Helianthus annuus]
MFDKNPPTVTLTVITALRLMVLTVLAVVDSLAMALIRPVELPVCRREAK